MSANGYSKINAEQAARYGVDAGEYEEACADIMRRAIEHLRNKFRGAQLRMVYGASDTGIDAAIEKVAREFNIALLGFSCPRFMLYVKDDDIPVYVANTKDEYADLYIKSLDLLITTGGRAHALQHDVTAGIVYNKRIHFVDVLNILSRSGGVPATVPDGKGGVQVDNAAAAFGINISFFNQHMAVAQSQNVVGDEWDAVINDVQNVATVVCRGKMSAARKFGN